jgi:hypothetical protein
MGTPVPPSFIAEMLRHGANIPEPGIFRQPLGDSEIRREPLSTWGQFFPDVPPLERETFAYPPPFSDEFWKAYAEPLTDFLMAAAMLRRALEGLRGLGGPGRQAKDAQRAAESSRDLAALLTPINAVPMIDGKRGAVSIRWASGSLLASCAMQALIALSGDGRVVVCTCGKVLISRDPRMMFCSPKCRWKAHQKAHRAKKKQRAKQRQGDSR